MQYKTQIPKVGGLILYSLLFSSYFYNVENNYNNYFIFSFVIIVLGIIDDYYDLFPMQKLIGQIMIVSAFLIFSNYNVFDIYFIVIFQQRSWLRRRKELSVRRE